jgi:hypothetical protein
MRRARLFARCSSAIWPGSGLSDAAIRGAWTETTAALARPALRKLRSAWGVRNK